MRHFDEQLDQLFKRIVMMGSLAESMIPMAVRVYEERDEKITADLAEAERKVNSFQVEVDETAIRLTMLQQPVARDARFLFMASRIGGELERIADQAINISQNARHALGGVTIQPLVDLPIMGGVVQKMVRTSLTAMGERNVALAERVLDQDEQVDAFRDQIFRIVLTHMMSDPRTIGQGISLILMARNLERIGDHATNIAEEVIYWVQGRDVRHQKPGTAVAGPLAPAGNGAALPGMSQG